MADHLDQDQPMTHFRLRWVRNGGHIHVGVWSGTERDTTHSCNGRLVFRPDEWDSFVRLCRDAAGAGPFSAIEIIRENKLGAGNAGHVEAVEREVCLDGVRRILAALDLPGRDAAVRAQERAAVAEEIAVHVAEFLGKPAGPFAAGIAREHATPRQAL